MINFKTRLAKKEKTEVTSLLSDLVDIYSDFYITKNNLRLFIKENPDVLFDCLNSGDKIAYDEHGLAVILGFSDGANRKYLKVLAKEDKNVEALLKVVCWNIKEDLYVKIKKNNPIRKVFEDSRFVFVGGRGKELLLVKKYVAK